MGPFRLQSGCSRGYWRLEGGCGSAYWQLERGCSSAYWQVEGGCISGARGWRAGAVAVTGGWRASAAASSTEKNFGVKQTRWLLSRTHTTTEKKLNQNVSRDSGETEGRKARLT